MVTREVKKMVEQVVRTEYVADDGAVFRTAEECELYENSALFAVSKNLVKLNNNSLSVYDLFGEGYEDNEVEIFDIQTEKDLENLRRYLYLKIKKNNASESTVENCFDKFKDITIGHEVIICWSYDEDCFWFYGNGSLEGYYCWLQNNMKKLIEKTEENEQNS